MITQTWILDTVPSREETYRRIKVFIDHCDKMGIPNAQYLTELYEADERWKRLHKNAVPGIIEFVANNYIDENKKIKKMNLVEDSFQDQDKGDFDFNLL
ncbi:MAG: hypothetical protein GTO20_26965 [Candidatus Aminicenantes bacterium]|nr:hypothetical protein [Candidatus Aminicenantes bacterium]